MEIEVGEKICLDTEKVFVLVDSEKAKKPDQYEVRTETASSMILSSSHYLLPQFLANLKP